MKLLGLTLVSLLLVPSTAAAATADADVHRRSGVIVGPVTFRAGAGEANRLAITTDNGRIVFRDSANPVVARGDCEQVDRHAARCPFSEDIPEAHLGDRADTARLDAFVRVFGGSGDDVLRGDRGGDFLAGEAGNDALHGGSGNDELTGGPGRDSVFGDRGDDKLVDGETDAQSAPDLYRGGDSRDTAGADRGDVMDYSLRRRALSIDLGRGRATTGDRILGLESVVGGRGDDRLTGDGDDNNLEGGRGADVLRGRGGDDIPMGGAGDDDVDGGEGNDVVWGDGGRDRLSGGSGDDFLIARDGAAEDVRCGSGDDSARNNPTDVLTDCEVSHSGSLYVKVQPSVASDVATFGVACQRLGGCSGTLSITSLDGEDYGSGRFTGLPDDPQTFTDVAVRLTPAGAERLTAGRVVQVTYGDGRGYRAVIRG